MRTAVLLLALTALTCSAYADDRSVRREIAEARTLIKDRLREWNRARAEKEEPPAEAMLDAFSALGRIPKRAALETLAGYLKHRDMGVARLALKALMVPKEEPFRLYAGRLISLRLSPKLYDPKRRALFTDMLHAVSESRYLGAYRSLDQCLKKIRDGEVVALVAETWVTFGDYRAIQPLMDRASFGKTVKTYDATPNPRSMSPMSVGPSDLVRANAGTGPQPSPEEKWVIEAVHKALYKLIGREGEGFKSYDEYIRFMSAHRGEFKEKAAKSAALAKEQEKKIRGCP